MRFSKSAIVIQKPVWFTYVPRNSCLRTRELVPMSIERTCMTMQRDVTTRTIFLFILGFGAAVPQNFWSAAFVVQDFRNMPVVCHGAK